MKNMIEHKLVITSGPDAGKEYHLLQQITTVGSAPFNDVQLNDQGVSDFHAEIRISNNVFSIVDLASDQGTFVNKERVFQEKHLTAGDRIQMGSAQAVFSAHSTVGAKACNPNGARKEVFKRIKPYYEKWMSEKHKKIFVIISDFGEGSGSHPKKPKCISCVASYCDI